jgi:predicted acetyltransferase
MIQIRKSRSEDEARRVVGGISHYFGTGPEPTWAERIVPLSTPERFLGAWDGDELVGGAGAFALELTVPGGIVECCGTTTVGVLPTHRRRGILGSLMRAQLDDAHERGEPIAALWASEGAIYGRYGFGLASMQGSIDVESKYAPLRASAPPAKIRLVSEAEALEVIPGLYDEVRPEQPGMFARSRAWWEVRTLSDREPRRQGGGEMTRAVLELDGRPAAYALYRVQASFDRGASTGHTSVIEALAVSPAANHALWEFLLGIDWLPRLKGDHLPPDHALFLLTTEPRRLNYTTGDALWVRLLDVGAALSARSYRGDGRVVLEVRDPFCEWNTGRWAVEREQVRPTNTDPDLRLEVADLASPYLGGFTFAQLARAGRVEVLVSGALERADQLFSTSRLPWCPEIF